jgi:hypothetical protein
VKRTQTNYSAGIETKDLLNYCKRQHRKDKELSKFVCVEFTAVDFSTAVGEKLKGHPFIKRGIINLPSKAANHAAFTKILICSRPR